MHNLNSVCDFVGPQLVLAVERVPFHKGQLFSVCEGLQEPSNL